MKIIYLSNTLLIEDFEQLKKEVNYQINPSNQNFHYRFINALGFHTEVHAYSLRPILKKKEKRILINKACDDNPNIKVNYLPNRNNLIYRLLKKNRVIYKILKREILKSDEKVVILVDSLKYSLAKVALKLKKFENVKVYGIITDNPVLLSNESKLYSYLILNQYRKYDRYLCLSKGLNDLANPNYKPVYFFHGFSEEVPKFDNPYPHPYFFTCGALYERYGIVRLMNAFLNVKTDYHLLIAGHGPLVETINEYTKKDERIKYIGLLSKEEVLQYEQHAELNINPRIYDKKLDKYSLPSKVLEFLASGTPLLSTIHTALYKEYKHQAIWIKNDSEEAMCEALKRFLVTNKQKLKENALEAKAMTLQMNGLKEQGRNIYDFIVRSS